MRKLFFYSLIILFIACDKEDNIAHIITTPEQHEIQCIVPNGNSDYVYYDNEEWWLKGGVNPEDDFNISNWQLDENYLKFGLGREAFKALVEPEFVAKEDYPHEIDPNETVVVVHGGIAGAKVYTERVLENHEVINDEINDTPIAITYCPLADFFAVYKREYCETILTFAVSGYTYYECDIWDNKDGFILWDRNTESLWWPLIDKGVSGEMLHQPMQKLNAGTWEVTTYGQVVQNYADFVLLKPNQTIDLNGAWTTDLMQPDCEE